MIKKVKGVWFYGLSGSGKSYASNFLKTHIDSAFVVDGDDVRRHVSTDLGYTEAEREVQINRILGIAQIALLNECFPIVSSVTMSSDIFDVCTRNSVDVIELLRPIDQLVLVRSIYKNSKNVVGLDIDQPQLETVKLFNDGSDNFERELFDYVKQK